MKSLIIYYSYSGNTKKAAQILKEILSGKGAVDIHILQPEDESRNFFVQAIRAFIAKNAVLRQAPFDVSEYDLLCIGTPVWAFAPAPAVNSYIDGLKNVESKDAICFITYGSGTGAERCLNKMKEALRKKGINKLSAFKIQQFKMDDHDFVKGAILKAIEPLQN